MEWRIEPQYPTLIPENRQVQSITKGRLAFAHDGTLCLVPDDHDSLPLPHRALTNLINLYVCLNYYSIGDLVDDLGPEEWDELWDTICNLHSVLEGRAMSQARRRHILELKSRGIYKQIEEEDRDEKAKIGNQVDSGAP